ncbi:MAG: diadenylate cyclase CdaA [Oscillospiraceae bacterium]|nr:diadenylate cyclase CdaA [Oscillospiraceae bacterium]
MSSTISNILSIFNTFSWRDAVDILVVAYLIYTVINLLIHTRTGLLIKGAVVLLVAYFLATNLQLRTIKFLIDYLFRYGLVVLVVIFQPELRTVLEKIGRTELGRSLFISRLGSTEQDSQKQAIDIITTAAERLSSTNTGALIVFEKETPLTDIISTGTTIDAEVSEELIGNIFYKGAPLHDGAVVIRKDRIVAAACLLPVSHNLEISRDMGTRHRAALGISENSDAVVLVVSEENGFISIAQNGSIVRQLDKNRAYQMLTDELCPERQDGSDQLPWYKRILGNAKVSKQ